MSNFSEKIKELTRSYEEKVKEVQDNMSANSLFVFNDEEIRNRRTAMLKELDTITDEYDKTFSDTVQQFINTYALQLPEDGKDHALHISNALKVIDMLGNSLDADNLNNILAPMVKDYKSVKTICDVIMVKHSGSPMGGYNRDVISAVYDHLGITAGIPEYTEKIVALKNAAESTSKYGYSLDSSMNSRQVRLLARPSYNVMCTPDWIEETAKMYNSVTNADFFKR